LQNKDEVLIPLLTNTLPSAKEFKDSIASLSPEQQDFARSFRKMQLESSVFGICIIQLRPQLEKLLGLPDCALTKEIQLTQDLLSLFVEYQIPSDLMTFDGEVDSDTATKVAAVRGHVKSIMDVIESSKEKQLIEEERKADMRIETSLLDAVEAEKGSAGSSQRRDFFAKSAGLVGSAGSRRKRSAGAAQGSAAVPHHHIMQFSAAAYGSPESDSWAMCGQPAPAALSAAPLGSSKSPKRTTPAPHAEGQPTFMVENVQPAGKPDSSKYEEQAPTQPMEGEDFTMIPKILDTCIEKFDSDHALRSCIIKSGPSWTLMRQANLLMPIKSKPLSGSAIHSEKKKAFDLLDAISRSGVLPIHCSELHVIVGVSHCFDNNVVGSVVQDNMNPIEKVERSGLMIASTIHAEPPAALIRSGEDKDRLANTFPLLLKSSSPLEADSAHSQGSNSSVTRLVERLNSSR